VLWLENRFWGSYGPNLWVTNPPAGLKEVQGYLTEYNWRTPHVNGANNIPLFLDCAITSATVWPEDTPPQFDGQYWAQGSGGSIDEMRRFCVNRHDGFVNAAFLDYSVRKVGLKELWKLKWHRNFNTNYSPTVWPEWMRGFKDY